MLPQKYSAELQTYRGLCQGGVTRVARGFFRALAASVAGIYMDDLQWQAMHRTNLGTHAGETVCGGLEAVVDMDSVHLFGPSLRASKQQSSGISATAVGYPHRQGRCVISESSEGGITLAGAAWRQTFLIDHGEARSEATAFSAPLFGVGCGVGKTAIALQALVAAVKQLFNT